MPGERQAHASQTQVARGALGVPGAGAAVLIAIASALIAGYSIRPIGKAPESAAPSANSRLAEVAPDEIGAALDTVAAPPEQLAQFRAQETCRRKLAWVTIAHQPNRPAGRIRLQSGKYISPAFELTDVPVRVALPYPAPYPAGHGTISVLGTSSDADVALTPPWQVAAGQEYQSRQVTWTPVGLCPAANPAAD